MENLNFSHIEYVVHPLTDLSNRPPIPLLQEGLIKTWAMVILRSFNSISQVTSSLSKHRVHLSKFDKVAGFASQLLRKMSRQADMIINAYDQLNEGENRFLEDLSATVNFKHLTSQLIYGMNLATVIPFAVYSTYDLVKNWRTAPLKLGLMTFKFLNAQVSAASSVSTFITTIQGLSRSARGFASQLGAVLGPISLSVCFATYGFAGTVELIRANRLSKQAQAANSLGAKVSDPLSAALFKREEVRLKTERQFAIGTAAQSYILAAGYGTVAVLSTLLTVGVLAAALTNPIGWAVVGIVVAGALISVGTFAYKRKHRNVKQDVDQVLAKQIIERFTEAKKIEILNQWKDQKDFNIFKPEDQEKFIGLTQRYAWSLLESKKPDEVVNQIVKQTRLEISKSDKAALKSILAQPDSEDKQQQFKAEITRILNSMIDQIHTDNHTHVVKLWQSRMQRLVKKEVKNLAEKESKKIVLSLIDVIPQDPALNEELAKLEKKKGHDYYINKIFEQASWPGAPNLSKQIFKELELSFLV